MTGFVTPAKAWVQRGRYPLDSPGSSLGQACLRRNDEEMETRV